MSLKTALTLKELKDKLFDYLKELLPGFRIVYQTLSELRMEDKVCVINLVDMINIEKIDNTTNKYAFTYNIELQGQGSADNAIVLINSQKENNDFFNYIGLIELEYLTNSSKIFRTNNQERATLLLSFYAVITGKSVKPYEDVEETGIILYDEKIEESRKISKIEISIK